MPGSSGRVRGDDRTARASLDRPIRRFATYTAAFMVMAANPRFSTLRTRALLLLCTLATSATLLRSAHAHDESVSTSHVEVSGQAVIWKVDVGITGLAKVVALPVPESQLDASALAQIAPAIGAYLARGVTITADGQPLQAEVGTLEPRYETTGGGAPVLSRVEQTLRFVARAPVDTLAVQLRFFSDLTSQHRSIVRVQWGDDVRQFVRLGQPALLISRASLAPSPWSVGGEFFRWGMHHIFVGFDHIAFLLALLLAATSLRALIVIVSAFTIAHSFTLLLAALGWVAFPARLTEALIAASIVYVAAENLSPSAGNRRHRWALTFAFGLVHGLGFATELRHRLEEVSGAVLWPVVCFNVGVEVGQLAIVVLVYPLLRKLRSGPTAKIALQRQRRLVTMGSVFLLFLGLFWLVARLSG